MAVSDREMIDDTRRLAQIQARVDSASEGPWTARPHMHHANGCRCLSCYDPASGWTVDHPKANFCDDNVALRSADGEKNDFGRDLAVCDEGPLLSYQDAEFAAHARDDVPWLLAQVAYWRERAAASGPTEGP